MSWHVTEGFVASEDMSRAEELQMIQYCLVEEVARKTDDPHVRDLALLVTRFVHLVAAREAQEDADTWAHIVGDEGCDSP